MSSMQNRHSHCFLLEVELLISYLPEALEKNISELYCFMPNQVTCHLSTCRDVNFEIITFLK